MGQPKGLSTLDTQCALNRIESSLSASTLNAHSPNPDSIWINPNPLPEVVSIRIGLDRVIACCAWGPKRVWHACSCWLLTVSALLWATQCSMYLLNSRSNMMAGWSTDLTRVPMVAVWRCGHLKSCEFVLHNAVWTRSMRIGFALNSHWAIRLLNWFESGFSVDRP